MTNQEHARKITDNILRFIMIQKVGHRMQIELVRTELEKSIEEALNETYVNHAENSWKEKGK